MVAQAIDDVGHHGRGGACQPVTVHRPTAQRGQVRLTKRVVVKVAWTSQQGDGQWRVRPTQRPRMDGGPEKPISWEEAGQGPARNEALPSAQLRQSPLRRAAEGATAHAGAHHRQSWGGRCSEDTTPRSCGSSRSPASLTGARGAGGSRAASWVEAAGAGGGYLRPPPANW